MDIAEFLLARIAEDEAAAREAGGEWWYAAEMPPPSMRRMSDEPTHWIVDSPATLITYEVVTEGKAGQIARWSPARVLAECEAKRRIVERAKLAAEAGMSAMTTGAEDAVDLALEAVLELLALPYADHPDYDPAWSVTAGV